MKTTEKTTLHEAIENGSQAEREERMKRLISRMPRETLENEYLKCLSKESDKFMREEFGSILDESVYDSMRERIKEKITSDDYVKVVVWERDYNGEPRVGEPSKTILRMLNDDASLSEAFAKAFRKCLADNMEEIVKHAMYKIFLSGVINTSDVQNAISEALEKRAYS